MSTHRNHRPWLAALLAVVQPGLGHVYLREWLRAVTWFVLWLATVLLVVPFAFASGGSGGVVATVGAAMTALEEAPLVARLTLLAVTSFSAFDAYWLAAGTRAQTPDVAQCPNCGKEVDDSLEFCHWCTEALPNDSAP